MCDGMQLYAKIEIKLKKHNIYINYIPILTILAIFFPSIWFIDSFFVFAGGRPVKMISWSAVIIIATFSACSLICLRGYVSRQFYVAMTLVFAMALYFALGQILFPPPFHYKQTIGVCVLAPLGLFLGLLTRNCNVSYYLMLLGASVFILFTVSILLGTFKLDSEEFQSLLQVSTSEDSKNTGYQGLSFMAGFLPIYLLGTMAEIRRRTIIQIIFFSLTSAPVLFIGGRSALVGLFFAFNVWLLFSFLNNSKQWLLVSGIIFTMYFPVGVFLLFPDLAPLTVKRLLWLANEDVQDSSMRFELWSAAIQLWLQSPSSLLFGHGPQQFPLLAGYDDPELYPHNFILELLSEYGLLGLSLFLSAPCYLILCQAKRGLAHFTKLKSPFFLVYYLAVLSFSGALQSLWPLFFFIGWLGAESDPQYDSRTKSALAKIIA